MFHLLLLLGFFSLAVCLPRQYHFINEKKTWAEAQRYCREKYTDLATIDTIEDMSSLLNTVTGSYLGSAWIVNNNKESLAGDDILETEIWNSRRSWIGLYNDLNSWKWSLNDDSFYKEGERSFRNWYIQKPMNWNENELCVTFVTYSELWTETSCSNMHPFICFDGKANASERYVLVTQNMNWTEAQSYCREHYTDLTSVRNDTENQKIGSLFSPYDSGYNTVWIGLYRTRSWSDKSNSSFRNWKPGQPDNYRQNESCTAVAFNDSGKWTDENCSQVLPFLCYITTTSKSTSSRQYYLINQKKTWTEAQRYCREKYTDLATIDNMEDMSTLLNTVNDSYSGLAWIGLYDDLDSWRWSLDDDAYYQEGEREFRGWYQQPDNFNGQELCVSMSPTGEWFDQPCTTIKAFVCYNSKNGSKNLYVGIYYKMTWEEAQKFCRANHTDLASVRNETELQQILSVTNGSEVWIGLYRSQLWSDQSNLSFTYWRPEKGEWFETITEYFIKVHRNQRCAAMDLSGHWTYENCFTSFPFICYTTFNTGAMMRLQVKIKANGNLFYPEIKRLVLMKLRQELKRQEISRDFILNVRNIQKLGPDVLFEEVHSIEREPHK
ncbi:macrophage mannose receptor 1-like [Neoarius graeffei]|uniref:macrophage mannose receptor 1-like n=1 Tax=Neoarius graeffei TaxID=443677 RepID=UPI00298CA3A0|nr:macrophage mannose receptor 1-like [Neoarius graeffei]XP_060791485.1 macrophage mannose receptor 1-like [Neoarius graeffei]